MNQGDRCENDVNECELFGPTLCKNGTCKNHMGSYKCECSIGFTGDNCEINIDDCVNNLCYKGSTCKDGDDHYDCICSENRLGYYLISIFMCGIANIITEITF